MRSTVKRTLATGVAVALAGCSSIGTINGVSLDAGRMGATETPGSTFCEQQPATCIAAGVAIVGGIIALGVAGGNHDNGGGGGGQQPE